MRWIIDTDAGVDDAVALIMPFTAAGYPDFHLEAITTVCGNVTVDKVNINVGALLDLLNLPGVPFYAGCDRPMLVPHVSADEFHGADGLGDAGLSVTSRKPEAEHAAAAIVRLARQYAGELSIIALGPLTNLALACSLDPELPQNIKQLVIMGGAWQARGNQSPVAEFNIAIDPESAHMVFQRFSNIVLVPWEASLQHPWSFDRIHAIAATGTPRAKFLAALMGRTERILVSQFHHTSFPAPDPMAVAVALDPTLITAEARARVFVDVHHGHGRAITALDLRHTHPNTRVVTAVNEEKFLAMIEAGWSTP